MSFLELCLVSFSLAMDAFAAAISKGAAADRPRLRDTVTVALVLGGFEAVTPIVGWLVGASLGAWVQAADHWIAFVLLAAVGGHMIRLALKPEEEDSQEPEAANSPAKPARGLMRPVQLLVMGLATSIDATVVGLSLALVDVDIIQASLVIGGVTTGLCLIGGLLGKALAAVIGRRAEILGGVALIGVGTKILIEHLMAG